MEDKERRGCQCIYVQKSFSPGIESFVVQASIERNDPQLQALFDLGPTRSEAQRQSAHAFSMQCDLPIAGKCATLHMSHLVRGSDLQIFFLA
jgi:hypothetical protein